MDRKWVWLLCLMILAGGISGCAAIEQKAQSDLGKLMADIQTKKTELSAQLPAAIAYATAKGDLVFCDCLNAVQVFLALPQSVVPDISNKFIDFEIGHQAVVAGLGGVSSIESDPGVQILFRGCSAVAVRTKGEILDVVAQIALMVK